MPAAAVLMTSPDAYCSAIPLHSKAHETGHVPATAGNFIQKQKVYL